MGVCFVSMVSQSGHSAFIRQKAFEGAKPLRGIDCCDVPVLRSLVIASRFKPRKESLYIFMKIDLILT